MKISVCLSSTRDDVVAIARRMAKSQMLETHHVLLERRIEGGALFLVDSTRNPLGGTLASSASAQRLIVSTGIPVGPAGQPPAWFDVLSNHDFDTAVRAASSFDGAHCTIVDDPASHRVAIVTDVLGMQPVYVYHGNDCTLVASELRAFPASGIVQIAADAAGWGAFLSFGHAISDRSMLDGVRRLPPATITLIDTRDLSRRDCSYWAWPEPGPEIPIRQLDTAALLGALEDDVRRYMGYSSEAALLLSGGFDSRLVMAMVIRHGGHPRAISVLHANEAGGADGRFAAALARRFGIEHDVHDTPRDFYRSRAYLKYIDYNQCSTQNLHLFIAQVAQHLVPSARAVWEGVFPGPCIRAPSSFVGDTKRNGISTSSGLWRGAQKIFTSHAVERMRQEFGETLDAEVDACGRDAAGARRFFVQNRTRYRTAANPLSVYANFVLPFTPGVNRALWQVNVNVSGRQDSKAGLYFVLFQRHLPEYLSVPVISSGTLYGRGVADIGYIREKGRLRGSALLDRIRILSGRRHGVSSQFDDASPLVERVVSHVSPDSPWLDADEVREIQRSPNGSTPAHKLLFYWQMWHWIMEGNLTQGLLEELTGPAVLPDAVAPQAT